MEATSKEILILCSIGRIKWLKAPKTLSEILFHLSRTFNCHPGCLILSDSNLNTQVSEETYEGLLSCDWEIILSLSIDSVLKELYSNQVVPSVFEQPKESSPKGSSSAFEEPEKNTESNQTWAPIAGLVRTEPKDEIANSWNRKPESARNEDQAEKTSISRSTTRGGRGKKISNPKNPAKIEDPEEKKMQELIKELGDWGFADKVKCRSALTKAKFDLNVAADILLSDS